MKKGALHVDWVISMGIFLIYIFALFVFLRPTIEPTIPEESIASMIIEKLDQDATINMERTPLFINQPGEVKLLFPFNQPASKYLIIDQSNLEVSFTIDNQFLIFSPSQSNLFWVIYSKDISHSNNYNCATACPDPLDEMFYSYGATEKIEGLSIFQLNQLSSNLKEAWNVQKDFSLTITEEDTELFSYSSAQIEQEIRVYVREYKDFIIDQNDGAIKKVAVNVKVW